MSYKKVALQRVGQEEMQDVQERNRIPLTYYIIFAIVLIFACDVAYETYDDLSKKFMVTDSESKSCFIDFQKGNCNALKLTE